MANDVDEFTIKYKVETGDASRKLEEFNHKLGNTSKATHGVRGFVADLGDHFTSAAANALKAGSVITAVMTAIYKSVTSVVDAMKDYNEQAIVAARTGLGNTQQEAIAMNLARASHGWIKRDESRKISQSVAEVVNQAYTDPTGSNRQNVGLKMMGISPIGKNGMVAGTDEVLDKLGKRWATMTQDMAEAESELFGITPQAADAIRDLAGKVSDTSNMTLEMVNRQVKAAEAAKALNSDLNQMSEDFRTMAKVIVDELMPKTAAFVHEAAKGSHILSESLNKEGSKEFMAHIARYYKAMGEEFLKTGKLPKGVDEENRLWQETAHKEDEENAREMRHLVQVQADAAKSNREASQKNTLSVNQFATSVSAMPGALTEAQAIAAWAGEAARGAIANARSGGTVSSSGAMISPGGPAPTAGNASGSSAGAKGNAAEAIDYFMAKGWSRAQAHGIAANLEIESGFNPAAHGDKDKTTGEWTAFGVAQWRGDRLKKFKELYGKEVKDSTRQEQYAYVDWELRNTERGAGEALQKQGTASGSASVVSRQYERPKAADWDAARRGVIAEGYYGSGPTSGGSSGAKTGGGGWGKYDSGMAIAGTGVAKVLGVDADALARGEFRKGDVQYAVDKQKYGIVMKIKELEKQINADDMMGRQASAQTNRTELFEQYNQFKMLDKYGGDIVAAQKYEGVYKTAGQMAIQPLAMTVNINGAQDPKEVARLLGEEVQKVLNEQATKMVN
jgi:Phage tail lysozyme